jgi:molybdopterin-guanine dinucleotide biosynthesis protein A
MNFAKEDITGIILAGGKSLRMGSDKALMLYKGKPMIQYSINLLSNYCNTILISANGIGYETFGMQVVKDSFINQGPMAGLLACLEKSTAPINICLPCDAPDMQPGVIEKLINLSDTEHCVVPLSPLAEPLIAIYPLTVIPVIRKLLEEGVNKMTEIFKIFPVHFIPFNNLQEFSEISSFNNINTPDDISV